MKSSSEFGNIVLLNGAPRSGKSSICREVQRTLDGIWLNFGVDQMAAMIPDSVKPGIGLRPGGECPRLEPVVFSLYLSMYESIAAFSRRGFHVLVDVGHHEWYAEPMEIFSHCLSLLEGLPVYTVGVFCPLDEILRRREATGYPARDQNGMVLPAILRWQEAVHKGKTYDLTLDTSLLSPTECAEKIGEMLFQKK